MKSFFHALYRAATGPSFKDMVQTFDKMNEIVRFRLWKQISRNFIAAGMTSELAKTLALQVENFLFAEDAEERYARVATAVQANIDQVKPLIVPKASELLEANAEIRELVRRTLMTRYILYSCFYGKAWLDTVQAKRSEDLMQRFANFFNSADPVSRDADSPDHLLSSYCACAYRFLQNTVEQDGPVFS